ncbi:MAG: TraR/DksA C4-type zinc finger protein [Patescibacteria group bacterium]
MTFDSKEMEALLDAEKEQLEEELTAHGRKVGADWQGTSNEERTAAADPNDVADRIETLATNVALVEELEERYRDVLAALDRLKNNSFGLCAECKQPIDPDRLEANPAALKCMDHA